MFESNFPVDKASVSYPVLWNAYKKLSRQLTEEEKNDLFCCIVNLHALTTIDDKSILSKNTVNAAIDFIALGLDPKKTTFWIQGDVPQVCQCTWLFSNITNMGLLDRSTSYKDKIAKGLKPIELIDPTNKNYIAKDYLSYTVDKNEVFKSMMDKVKKEKNNIQNSLSPREIVSELDRFVVGQNNAKRAVAIALRNRWRRQALEGDMKDEVLPKNILMMGPTGVGKTEISRRLSKLAEAPFVKVEATRFTEVGYVGRDVEQIIRDLLEIAIAMEKVKKRKEVHAKAQKLAEDRVLDAIVGNKASVATRESFRKRLRDGDLDDNEIEIAVTESGGGMPSFEIPGMPGANVGMINISDMLGKSMGQKAKKKKMSVKESHEILLNEEADKLIEQDKIIKSAKNTTENNGIVFLDEIDKISARTDRVGGDVSREGVQRDLLPLIEGTTVSTKYGPIKTDHILFIASGAFQLAKPSDLLPELQGRLPIRVELDALNSEDFKRILKEPDNSLIKQYKALLKTENVDLEFTEDGIDTIATIASEVNTTVENIGARRLHTIIERVLDEISFTATDRAGEKISIDSVSYTHLRAHET